MRRRDSRPAWLPHFVVDGHDEHDPLRKSRQDVDRPRAPTVPSQADEEARSHEEAAGRLHAHHWDTEAAGALEMVRRADLRDVLHGRQGAGHHAQQIGPDLKLARHRYGQDTRYSNDDEAMAEACQADNEGLLPAWLLLVGGLFRYSRVLEPEEYKEEHESRRAAG